MTNQKKLPIIPISIPFVIFFATITLMSITLPIIGAPSNISHTGISTSTTISLEAAYAQPLEDNNIITAELGDPIQLAINQTAIIRPDNMSIQFLEVPGDSRCPASALCIWAGQVTVSLNISTPSRNPLMLNLTLGPLSSNSSAKDVNSHIIKLLQVDPYPMTDQEIAKNDYRATLVVSERQANDTSTPSPSPEIPPSSPAAPIPTGEWDIVSNGLHGTLNITSIDSQGHLNGTISLYPFDMPSNEISGYVDGDSGKVTFVRIMGPRPVDIEVYTGYIFSNIIASCLIGTGPGSCYDHAQMAGTFESFYEIGNNNNNTSATIGTFGDGKRNEFGWFASHVPQPCPACPG